jgi:hypothetical protein
LWLYKLSEKTWWLGLTLYLIFNDGEWGIEVGVSRSLRTDDGSLNRGNKQVNMIWLVVNVSCIDEILRKELQFINLWNFYKNYEKKICCSLFTYSMFVFPLNHNFINVLVIVSKKECSSTHWPFSIIRKNKEGERSRGEMWMNCSAY